MEWLQLFIDRHPRRSLIAGKAVFLAGGIAILAAVFARGQLLSLNADRVAAKLPPLRTLRPEVPESLARLIMAGYDWLYGGDYASSWWYFFSFAIGAYSISIAGYTNAVQSRVLFQTALFGRTNEVFILPERPPYALPVRPDVYESIPEADARTASDAGLDDWKERIARLFETERLYEEPELTLQDVAQQLQTNISVLSRLVNRSFGMNFNDLVNAYRVQRVIELMQQGQHQSQTLLALAFEAGFNSKTTFNRAFKKQTGLSPKVYLQQRMKGGNDEDSSFVG